MFGFQLSKGLQEPPDLVLASFLLVTLYTRSLAPFTKPRQRSQIRVLEEKAPVHMKSVILGLPWPGGQTP